MRPERADKTREGSGAERTSPASFAAFQASRTGAKIAVVVAVVAATLSTLVASGVLLLLALFDRSIHGPPPSALMLALPFAAALAAGWLTFVLACRLLRSSVGPGTPT